MTEKRIVQRAIKVCRDSYKLIDEYEHNLPAQLSLYRSAAITIEALVLNDIVGCPMPTKADSQIDDEFYLNVCEMAQNRKWEVNYYKDHRDRVPSAKSAIDLTIAAIEVSADLYELVRDKLTKSAGNWGSVLDIHSLVTDTILTGYEALHACEETFSIVDYSHSVMGYWAAFEAFRASQILISSYNPETVRARPQIFNLEGLEHMTSRYIAGSQSVFEAMNQVLTPESLRVIECAIKAFDEATRATEQAMVNLRAINILDGVEGAS